MQRVSGFFSSGQILPSPHCFLSLEVKVLLLSEARIEAFVIDLTLITYLSGRDSGLFDNSYV